VMTFAIGSLNDPGLLMQLVKIQDHLPSNINDRFKSQG